MTQIIVIHISTETRKTNTTENLKRTLTLILDNYNAHWSSNHHKTITGEHTNKKTENMAIPQNVLYATA